MRTYRVEVVSGARECRYLLAPDSLGTSRLLRDERLLGVFASSGDGRVSVDWEAAGDSERARDPNAAFDLWP
ncbi:hypothetical protein ACFQ77_19790 [Streptomyces virginiae]|uniref:hypothetical protein n=1 Tax=Streptomyces virginiae TaxID=1961 RepID=UPI003699BB88